MDSFDSSWDPVVHSLCLHGPWWLPLEPIRGQSGPIEGPQGPMDLDLEPGLALGALLTHQICPIWDANDDFCQFQSSESQCIIEKRVFVAYGQCLRWIVILNYIENGALCTQN